MPENIEIRSEEVQEIIGTPPARIIRIGITVIFAIIFMILIGSFFFKYPDIITARISLKGDNPSAEIKARINGKITELFVKDKQEVKEEQIIAIIENTCNYQDLLKLKNEIDSFENQHLNIEQFSVNYKFDNKYRLGEIQTYYSTLESNIKGYKDFIELDFHKKKIGAYKKQIKAYNKHLINLKRQVKLSKKDFYLSEKQLKRDSGLYIKEFLSVSDFEKSKSNVIQKNNAYESYLSSLSTTEIRIADLEQNILETELQKINQKREFETKITETIANLKAQIKLWEQNYLLKSPVDGIITFINYQNINQNVSVGETVFTIVPGQTSKLIGYAEIPLSGSGKVKPGQNVNVKFDDFPYTQFGMVRAKIDAISLVQSNEFYIATLSFPDSLNTNYKKELHFKQNMKGNADIITEELPLAARIINPIKSLFYEKF
ncbi:MAG: HlyD family efflux transporter periplasmic adaptor subunit [Bacteroidales bacterium]|nr:HlyD family efflux transporter periplasmic adaptor subunit [Bacteroidales bacterium]